MERYQREKLTDIICLSKTPEEINANLNWLIEVIPEIKPMIGMQQKNPYHCYTVWEHTVYSILYAPSDITIKLTMFFHDIEKPSCYTYDNKNTAHFYGHPQKSSDTAGIVLKRFSFQRDLINDIVKLVFYHDCEIPTRSVSINKWLNKLGEELFNKLILVKTADTLAQSKKSKAEKLSKLKKLEKKLTEVLEQRKQFSKKDLHITGRDLIDAGVCEGRNIGIILDLLQSLVIAEKLKNERDELLKTAIELISEV